MVMRIKSVKLQEDCYDSLQAYKHKHQLKSVNAAVLKLLVDAERVEKVYKLLN